MASEYKMLINGQLVDGEGNVTYDVLNPSTEEVLAKAPHASKTQVDAAVDAAEAAFPAWMATPIEKRREAMREALRIWASKEDELTKLLVKEQGKPVDQATWEVSFTKNLLQHAIDIKLPVDVCEDKPDVRVEVHRRPIGVVVGITPWNFPLLTSVQKWAPAIVLGNTFIWKPSPYTPLTALYLSALLKDVFPPGVLNTVSGDDKSSFNVGAYLTTHPKVSKVTFTGSVKTGMRIMAGCAGDVKRVTLELGGNDAAIVRGDCDPKDVAPKIFTKAFANNGQVCVAVKRCFVQRNIYDEFVKEITAVAKSVKVGDGFEPGVVCGPLNNKMQLDHVKSLVEDSRSIGATIHCGGQMAAEKGYFYQPTIITNVKEGNRIVDEEQFGPVLPIMPYDTDDEAVQRANGTPYGLGGSVWSKDVNEANKLARRVRAGTVWVNDHMAITGGPFGGFKWSGLGRELGDQDLVAYTEVQTLSFAK